MAINQVLEGGIVASQPREQGAAMSFMLKVWNTYNGKTYTQKLIVEAFGKAKDQVSNLRPGQSVLISGRLNRKSYEKNGQKVYETVIVASNIETGVQFIDPDGQGGGGHSQSSGNHQPSSSASGYGGGSSSGQGGGWGNQQSGGDGWGDY